MTLRVSDWQSESDLDSVRNSFDVFIYKTSWSNCSFPAFISEVDTIYICRVLSIPLDPFQKLHYDPSASIPWFFNSPWQVRLGQGGDPQKQRSSTERWGRRGRSSCWGSPTNTRGHRLVLDKPRQLVWQARGSQDQELVGQRWEPAELGGPATLLIGGKPRTKNRPSSSQVAITLTYLARLTEWTAKWE